MNMIKPNTNTDIRGLQYKGVMLITPEIAKEMLKKNFVNRKLNTRRVGTYAYDMENNNWEKVVDGLSLQFDNEENLMNGQHRLSAIIKSGKPQNMFIFQSDINANALALPFDTGMNRTLAMIMKKSKNYISLITHFIYIGIGSRNKISPAMITRFEDSLTQEQVEVLEYFGNASVTSFSTGIKAAFFLAYIKGVLSKDEIIDLWKASITQDYENPKACQIRDFAKTYGGWNIKGGMFAKNKIFTQMYGILNQYQPQKYTTEKYYKEIMTLTYEWTQGRF